MQDKTKRNLKVIITIFAACDVVFSLFVPISIALLMVATMGLSPYFIIPFGIAATFGRAFRYFVDFLE